MKIKFNKKELNEKILKYLWQYLELCRDKNIAYNSEIIHVINQINNRLIRQARSTK